ncbi:MAG: hypothetical protein HQL59_13315, partial [Magnetococcales bacterium]|nr:hypothetical protein [Magnetococcales bacterium]
KVIVAGREGLQEGVPVRSIPEPGREGAGGGDPDRVGSGDGEAAPTARAAGG